MPRGSGPKPSVWEQLTKSEPLLLSCRDAACRFSGRVSEREIFR